MSINRYRLLVIDIDGTLLNGQGKISGEDMEAIARVREQGIRVSLSTGRALKASLGVLEQLSLDSYHVFFDGALVSSPDLTEEVYTQEIMRETVKQMIHFAHSEGINLELYSFTQYFAEQETWSTKAHSEFFGIEFTPVDFTGIWERERIIKGGISVTNTEEEAKADDFNKHFSGSLHLSQARTPAYPGVVFNNILAPQVSKGKAVSALASYIGVPLEDVMAVGDGSNDISLLSAVGLSVAMGNAPNDVKAVADYVTLDVENSGLAAAINKFLLCS